jgi:hypothetical protein
VTVRAAPLRFLISTALLLTGCDQLRPFEQVCEKRLAPGSVTVTAPATDLRYDFTQTASALTARHDQTPGHIVQGLAEINLKTSLAVGGSGIVKPMSGRYCTRPEVQVTLAYRPLTVYIAKEQPPGSCAHELTLSHEMKHVRSYERFIDELAAQLDAELKTLLGDGIHYFASAAEGERELNDKINARAKAVMDAGIATLKKRQALIDSPEEYGRIDSMQSKCS